MVAQVGRLNQEILSTLKELDDGSFFSELVQLFLDNIPQLLHSLDEAIKQKNERTIQLTAHKLKGSCGNIGADFMAELASQLETPRTSPTREELLLLVQRLREEFSRITELLQNEVRLQLSISSGLQGTSSGQLH